LVDIKKQKITLEELEKQYSKNDYIEFYNLIESMVDQGSLIPIKDSGANGMVRGLFKRYWLISEIDDISIELRYIHGDLNVSYYRTHPEIYKKDKMYIEKLSRYLYKNSKDLLTPMAINERSFAIFNKEKFLKEVGRGFLSRVRISLDKLNVYETPEPFLYFSKHKNTPQSVWVVENKDTWYSLKKALLEGVNNIFGVRMDTIIYIAGKERVKAFDDFRSALEIPQIMEEHLRCSDNIFYYLGDIDYEGICMYESLKEKISDVINITLNTEFYKKMIDKYESSQIDLPDSKPGQNKNIKGVFFIEMGSEYSDIIKQILMKGLYIPQEILNPIDFMKG
jgi:hypothetical protein